MPDTRPGIQFDENGVCYPCLAAERAEKTDWGQRKAEWLELCERHKKLMAGEPYDCILPASGGKDSHFQLKMLLEAGMRPLIVTVGDWFGKTRAGEHNFANLCQHADSYVFKQNSTTMGNMVRAAFFAEGSPTWPIDAAIYSVPLKLASMMGISLIVYGEDIAYTYGGPGAEETPSARKQNTNNVVKSLNRTWWANRRINLPSMLEYPNEEHMLGLEPVYLSYFFKWSGVQNYETARGMGFQSLGNEWDRKGFIEDYDQIDSKGYLVHPWLKYPKYGHARVTDVASNLIRQGKMSRGTAVHFVRQHDHELDPVALDDFLDFTGIFKSDFRDRVSTLYNRDLFDFQSDGHWRLKDDGF
jgi:N-acetyl sugar amidotransferase